MTSGPMGGQAGLPQGVLHHDGLALKKNEAGRVWTLGTGFPLMKLIPVVGTSAARKRALQVTVSKLPQRSRLLATFMSYGVVALPGYPRK